MLDWVVNLIAIFFVLILISVGAFVYDPVKFSVNSMVNTSRDVPVFVGYDEELLGGGIDDLDIGEEIEGQGANTLFASGNVINKLPAKGGLSYHARLVANKGPKTNLSAGSKVIIRNPSSEKERVTRQGVVKDCILIEGTSLTDEVIEKQKLSDATVNHINGLIADQRSFISNLATSVEPKYLLLIAIDLEAAEKK